jgi:hypothetical protein
MNRADLIVNTLLEADEDVDPSSYLGKIADERESGDISVYSADDYSTFYHRTAKYKDGYTPIQVRRNGRTKRWKTRPKEFQIPVKYGLKECFYIDQRNAHEWQTYPPEHPKPVKKKAAKKAVPRTAPERPAPVSSMSPEMHKEWEKEQAEKEMRVPRPPSDHPQLPL